MFKIIQTLLVFSKTVSAVLSPSAQVGFLRCTDVFATGSGCRTRRRCSGWVLFTFFGDVAEHFTRSGFNGASPSLAVPLVFISDWPVSRSEQADIYTQCKLRDTFISFVYLPGCGHHLFDTRHKRAQPAGF